MRSRRSTSGQGPPTTKRRYLRQVAARLQAVLHGPVRRSADVRICRNEGVPFSYVYALA